MNSAEARLVVSGGVPPRKKPDDETSSLHTVMDRGRVRRQTPRAVLNCQRTGTISNLAQLSIAIRTGKSMSLLIEHLDADRR
jgi:hypothetical protein